MRCSPFYVLSSLFVFTFNVRFSVRCSLFDVPAHREPGTGTLNSERNLNTN